MGIYVSKEQYDQACSVDLADWLLRNHPHDVKQQYGSVLLKADTHVSVKAGYHGFRNFKTDDKGNNVDYLMNYLGYSYQEAVLALVEDAGEFVQESKLRPVPAVVESKEIVLPKAAGQYRNLFAFLLHRKIPVDVIQMLIDRGLLYQSDPGNNAVFVTPEGDFCEMRGTNTYADKRCKHRGECKQYQMGDHHWCFYMEDCEKYKPDRFHGCKKTRPDRFWYLSNKPDQSSEVVYVCEAAIDAVSLYVLHREHNVTVPAVYVSIGGAANQQAIDRLRKHKNVVIATDNDDAGNVCRMRNADLQTIVPVFKDWNEDLQKGVYYGDKL